VSGGRKIITVIKVQGVDSSATANADIAKRDGQGCANCPPLPSVLATPVVPRGMDQWLAQSHTQSPVSSRQGTARQRNSPWGLREDSLHNTHLLLITVPVCVPLLCQHALTYEAIFIWTSEGLSRGSRCPLAPWVILNEITDRGGMETQS
jgi:hypothetical protein